MAQLLPIDARIVHTTMNSSLCSNDTSLASMAAANVSLEVIGQQCAQDFFLHVLYDFLQMFYIVWPSENTYDNGHDVPNYELNLIPMASIFMVLEQIIRIYQRKDLTRIQDLVTNVGSSIIFLFSRVLFLGIIIHVYIYMYDNYRILDMPLYSFWTWLVSLLLVEFVYYWTHRALHEFNILWAAHQFHHMAEDLNVSTAIRDSVVDLILYDIFPLPLSVLIPPQILVVHMQFSLIYQIWLHNSVVGNLGFIEYIVNTPRQHLVHHGKNPYCIDKNYGALLMIFDRMFGTYQQERPEDELVFGVVSPTPKTFDPMILQFGYYRDVYNKFMQMETFSDKMSALLKGPGWSPGKPRLGLISDVPEPDRTAPKYSYNPEISVWVKLYIGLHGMILLLGLYLIGHHSLIRFSYLKALVVMVFILLTLTSFGFIFDSKKFAPLFESLRCMLYFPFDYYIVINTPWVRGSGEQVVFDISIAALRLFYLSSAVMWLIHAFTRTDDKRYHGNAISNGNGKVEESKITKENGDSTNLSENIEMAKKFVAKQESKRFNLMNISATFIFLFITMSVTYVLYFVRVESCSQLINSFKH